MSIADKLSDNSYLSMNDTCEILDFWFTQFQDHWFNCSAKQDQLVSDKFEFYHNQMHNDIVVLPIKQCSAKQILACIIIYDQFYRHYRRVKQLGQVDCYNHLTCQWSQYLITSGLMRDLPTVQQCFVYLPLRHSQQLSLIQQVYETIRQDQAFVNHHQQFVKATRCDLEKALYHSARQTNKQFDQLLYRNSTSEGNNQLLDSRSLLSITDLSEFSPLTRIMIKIGVIPLDLFQPHILRHLDIYQHVLKVIITLQKQNVIKREIAVSLSGGVDSLLLLFVLLGLKADHYLDRVVAIHINYTNRGQTSQLEAEFVKTWCRYHQVDLYLREITELHRGHSDTDCSHQLVLDRAFYENFTRDIRYHFYQMIGLPVCFGHNRDDAFENMLSNIANSTNFHNLQVMNRLTVDQAGVQIIRPFLEINKLTIMQAARQMQLFHTQNSTPKWSNRYFLRHGIIDYFARYYPPFLLGLEKLNNHLIQSHLLVKTQLQQIIDKSNGQQIDKPKLSIRFQLEFDKSLSFKVPTDNDSILHPIIFQQTILYLSRLWKIQTPSHKSQTQNLQMIENYQQKITQHYKTGYKQKLHLSKDMKIFIGEGERPSPFKQGERPSPFKQGERPSPFKPPVAESL